MEAGLGTALIFTGLGLSQSRAQEKLDRTRIGYETQSSQLAYNEMALESTTNFRKAVGSQIALAGARGGIGSSDLAQFTTESYANYLNDQASIARKAEGSRIGSALELGQVSANRRARDFALLTGFGSSLLQSTNLNSLGKAAPKIKG